MSEFVTKLFTEDGWKQIDFQALGNFPVSKPGQVLRVTAVDENGNPTKWDALSLENVIAQTVRNNSASTFQKLMTGRFI